MKPEQLTRATNAVNEDMEVSYDEKEDAYLVKRKYVVDLDEMSCDCPDHEYRSQVCKHLIRVQLEVLHGNVPEQGTEETGDSPTPRPMALTPVYDNVPDALVSEEQWVCWAYKRDSEPTHAKDWTKVPINVKTGGFGSSTKSSTWVTFDDARHLDAHDTSKRTDGVGFVVSDEDAFVGIDIDNCRDADTGEIDEPVFDLLRDVNSYTEVSPSGTGLRIFVKGSWPSGIGHQTDLIAGEDTELEVYETGRYLTVTGHHVSMTPNEVRECEETIELFAHIMDPGRGT